MSRYTGPRLKVMRALGTELPGLSRKPLGERNYPPGQHGQRPKRKSGFGVQLIEKQKLRFNYGVGERQFRRLVKEAKANKMATGDKLLELLERRLDNAVFRSTFAPTIPAARQLIKHGHIQINGRRVDIPSYRVKPGDVISVRDKSKELAIVKDAMAHPSLAVPGWLDLDPSTNTCKVAELPDHSAVPLDIEVQLVVEYYAKRM